MGNHFHLALETPGGNLVAGMHWLQATFADRLNRLRGEHGHLFQARHKSLLVEEGNALWQLCHYIHPNPVRSGRVTVPRLAGYRHSSYWYLLHPAARPEFLKATTALEGAGGLTDTPAGQRSYEDYLAWQAAEGPAGKSAPWKLAIAHWLKTNTEARTKWMAHALFLGAPSAATLPCFDESSARTIRTGGG